MSLSVICYAQPDKAKSQRVIEAFAAGCGGRITWTTSKELTPHTVPVFYGVRPPWAHLWEQAKREQRDWIFIDNAYFDTAREIYFRVTKNSIQHSGKGISDGRRFLTMGMPVASKRESIGSTILACAQSDEFMRTVAHDPDWLPREVEQFRRLESCQVLVRHKGEKRPLHQDLKHARLVVTYSSAAAVTALLAGVSVKCSPACCAHGVELTERERWASVLADNQWTLAELAAGKANKVIA